jgi:hypothetical protein
MQEAVDARRRVADARDSFEFEDARLLIAAHGLGKNASQRKALAILSRKDDTAWQLAHQILRDAEQALCQAEADAAAMKAEQIRYSVTLRTISV